MEELYQAVKLMRVLTKEGIPFSFSFCTCNLSTQKSNGIKRVDKALLRTGMNQQQSDKWDLLIGYEDLSTGKNGWFYLPLLLELNNNKIK